jgi:trans-aconitate 2-methyltransferase
MQFATERTQPAVDLIARIQLDRPAQIIDLGCGPGNSTALLRQRWPQADIIGLDNSSTMLAAAAQAYPGEKWLLADAAAWQADVPLDLVFSNAALQWLPDHECLFPRLMAQVAPGGVFAVQIPNHYHSPLHEVVLEVADRPEWQPHFDGSRRVLTYRSPAFYYEILQPLATRLDLWETEYYHIVEGAEAIVRWFRSTGLRPFLEALATETQRQDFERQILAGYTNAYPLQSDGRVLFPFKRLFMTACR